MIDTGATNGTFGLPGPALCDINNIMPSTKSPITDPLRRAIHDSELPMLTIASATGINRASLIRFARGDTSLRLDVADKLAAYFGLELQAKHRRKRSK